MANISVGGDASRYMEAPTLNVGGGGGSGGGGSFIASVLDLLGVHRQVAKGDKPAKGASASPAPTSNSANAANSDSWAGVPLPAVAAASQAFTPIQPIPSTFGQSWLDSITPLHAIDPDDPTGATPSTIRSGFGLR